MTSFRHASVEFVDGVFVSVREIRTRSLALGW
jgi:hypothetical protein